MTMHNPAERTRKGVQLQTELLAAPASEPTTLLESTWRDYIFAEVWSRPGLDRRARFLVALAGSACEGINTETITGYARGALATGELTLAELREAALHLAVYAGWSRGTALDAAVTRAADELGLPPAEVPLLRAEPWDPQQRLTDGDDGFKAVMLFPSPPPVTPFFEGGILNFVFGEMWMRPGLDQRARRWITLVGVANSASTIPIRSHIYSAMASGNATLDEMQEFVLQYAIHSGWPKASVIQGAVFEMGKRVAEGLPYE